LYAAGIIIGMPPEKQQTLILNYTGQPISEVTITFARKDAPSLKPKILIANEYDENPLFDNLFNAVLRVTSAMSDNNWDSGLTADHADMDEPLAQFTDAIRIIDKEKDRNEARKMLDAVIAQVGKLDFFIGIPDSAIKLEQLTRTLHTHFTLAFDTIQNDQ